MRSTPESARQRREPELTFSAARLAAEAWFAPSAPVADPTDVADPDREARRVAAPQEQGRGPDLPPGLQRAPKVHRVARALPEQSAGVIAQRAGDVPSPVDAADPAAGPLNQARRLPRKKARRLHGEVLVIRPVKDERTAAELPCDAAWDAGISSLAWPRYPKLLARIQALKAQAERARQREVAEAIRWIQHLMAMHGISADELGLR